MPNKEFARIISLGKTASFIVMLFSSWYYLGERLKTHNVDIMLRSYFFLNF